jgi:hypothetical protein
VAHLAELPAPRRGRARDVGALLGKQDRARRLPERSRHRDEGGQNAQDGPVVPGHDQGSRAAASSSVTRAWIAAQQALDETARQLLAEAAVSEGSWNGTSGETDTGAPGCGIPADRRR